MSSPNKKQKCTNFNANDQPSFVDVEPSVALNGRAADVKEEEEIADESLLGHQVEDDNEFLTMFEAMNESRREEEFHRAVDTDNLDAVRCIVRLIVRQRLQGETVLVDIDCLRDGDPRKLTVLHKACRIGNLAVVESLIKDGRAAIKATTLFHYTPLHVAAEHGHVQIVRYLLQRQGGVDLILAKDNCQETALHKTSSAQVARLLLQYATSAVNVVLVQNRYNYTALHLAKSVDMVRLLYSVGGTQLVRMVDWKHHTALHRNAKDDANLALVQCLVESCQANLLQTDHNSYTALHIAISCNAMATAEYLQRRGGIDLVMATNIRGQTALHMAVKDNHFELAKSLVNTGGAKLVLVQDNNDKTAYDLINVGDDDNGRLANLMRSVGGDDLMLVSGDQAFLEFAYTPILDMVQYIANAQGGRAALNSPFRRSDRLACCLAAVTYLAQQVGTNNQFINTRDNSGNTPLHFACRWGSLATVQRLVEHGASVQAVDDAGLTVLMTACSSKVESAAKARLLVQTAGAIVYAVDNLGRTALHRAVDCHDREAALELVTCLVETCGADIRTVDHAGLGLLHSACGIVHNDAMLAFLLRHAPHNVAAVPDVNARDNTGRTPLHCACATGSLTMVQMLMDHHANVQAVDNAGRTVLMTACSSKVHGAAKIFMLVQAGANTMPADNRGLLALHYAVKAGQNVPVVRLLVARYVVRNV